VQFALEVFVMTFGPIGNDVEISPVHFPSSPRNAIHNKKDVGKCYETRKAKKKEHGYNVGFWR
jgi:hypothetical protein